VNLAISSIFRNKIKDNQVLAVVLTYTNGDECRSETSNGAYEIATTQGYLFVINNCFIWHKTFEGIIPVN
jgi:hypothetical protein